MVASPKFTIALVCASVLAGLVGVELWEAGRQERNGSAGLRARAVRFSEALDDAAQDGRLSALVPWLESPERASPAALTALRALAAVPRQRLTLVLARVRTADGGSRGRAEYLLASPDGSASSGPILVDWVKTDDTWYLDLVGS